MENTKTRVRINLTTKEVEWEGSEAFIEKQQSTILEFIEKIKAEPTPFSVPALKGENQNAHLPAIKEELPKTTKLNHTFTIPDSFGEFYMNFQRNAKVVDKILIAGYYVQSTAQDGTFSPKEVADLLDEQNVNVTNPSAFLRSLQSTGKIYKQGGKFKVHENGIEHIKQILNQP